MFILLKFWTWVPQIISEKKDFFSAKNYFFFHFWILKETFLNFCARFLLKSWQYCILEVRRNIWTKIFLWKIKISFSICITKQKDFRFSRKASDRVVITAYDISFFVFFLFFGFWTRTFRAFWQISPTTLPKLHTLCPQELFDEVCFFLESSFSLLLNKEQKFFIDYSKLSSRVDETAFWVSKERIRRSFFWEEKQNFSRNFWHWAKIFRAFGKTLRQVYQNCVFYVSIGSSWAKNFW